MKFSHRRFALAAVVTLVVAVAGCGGSGSDPKTGMISLGVSDGPISNANKVCVAFNQIEFKSGSDLLTVELADNVNLIEFQGANAAPLLFDYELPAGDYQWMRLGVSALLGADGGADDMDLAGTECFGDESYLVMNSGESRHNLYIPSGARTGLKLIGGFTVPAGGKADFTLEFDLRKSVTAPNGLEPDVILRPTIRLVNNEAVGTLVGDVYYYIATGILQELPSCDPWVYVFNDGVMPNAIIENVVDEFDPIATAMVLDLTPDIGLDDFYYEIGQLPVGNYEVAFTCDGENFTPINGKSVEIFAGQVVELDFFSL